MGFRKSTKPNLRRRKAYRKKSVPKSVKTYVKRTIARDKEDKLGVLQNLLTTTISQTNSTTIGVIQNLIPLINQGVDVCDRVGNKIKCKRLIYSGQVSRNSLNTSAVPQMTVCVIGRLKSGYDTPNLSQMNLLKYQSTNTGSPTMGTISSTDMRTIYSPYNRDVFDIKLVKYFKVFNASGMPNPFVNNDFKIQQSFSINLTKYVKKVWKYNNNVNNPENEGLYAMWFAVNIDSSVTFPATGCILLDSISTCYYEDA